MDAVLAACKTYWCQDGQRPLTAGDVEAIQNVRIFPTSLTCQETRDMAVSGLRVLAVAQGGEDRGMVFLGLVGFVDPPRQGVK